MFVINLKNVYKITTIFIFFVIISSIILISQNKTTKQREIFDISTYKLECTLTVISNKTENKYNIKEEYDGLTNTFYFEDLLGNEVVFSNVNNKFILKSKAQIYDLEFENKYRTNLLSLLTYLNMINNNKYFQTVKKENKYIITLNKDVKEIDEYSDIFSKGINVKKIEIFINNLTIDKIEVSNQNGIFLKLEYKVFNVNGDNNGN